jgi:hybrid cluster-associated redox disulfide protein
MGKYTKETILDEVLKSQEAAKVLANYSLPCLHCPMAKLESGMLQLGDIAQTYGIDIDAMLADLNKTV